MHHYPIYLSLETASVIVVGAGKVGRRKIASLSRAKAKEILVFDPALPEDAVAELEEMPSVRVVARPVNAADLQGKRLVFAASSDREENARIAALCSEADILCNVVDAPDSGTFIVPALTGTHGIMAAFSTDGQSPALARRIKEEARSWLEGNYGQLLVLMGRLRPLILELGLDSEENAYIFRSLAYSRLGELLISGDRHAVTDLLAILMPPALHEYIEDILDGLC
ncbi:MAG: Siroheme synthase [Desulfovibrio sp.]